MRHLGSGAYSGQLVSSPEMETPAAEAVSRVGQVISGRYLIKELLGEGGMGAVYLAEHTHMKKRVALKLLHPEMVDNVEVSARFEREALASAHIEHPNVAAATDFGKTEDGAFFLVLEYIEGTNLRDALEPGPLAVQRSIRIARQIALALERAHEAGIVHRDLKPENVMLVKKEGEPDFVKVLDFGIAKLLEGAASASEAISRRNVANGSPAQPLTRLGTVLGTPEYMAPEQALGEAVTPAADLYGVGVMMYEMLTGKHPFDPPDRMAMLSFHIVAPVPMMADRAPEVDVPPAVEAVVRCLLEKDSKKRYVNARALIEAIDGAAQASAIDLGGSTPAPVPSAPNSMRTVGGANVPASGTPDWAGNDAFAQTSIGLPAASPTAVGSDASPIARLARLPRNVLYVIAAGVPLALVAIVVLLVIAFRSGKPTDPKDPDDTIVTAPKGKTAPPDRVEAAVALGPDALEALAKEFPEDASLRQKLAFAYSAQGKTTESLRNVRALLAANPAAASDDEIILLVTKAAAKSQGTDDDEAFALLEGPLGERGVDALIELSTRAAGREVRDARDVRVRATTSLGKPEVRAHASQGAAILLDFKAATACAAKHDLLDRAKDQGDGRLLPALKQIKQARGRGFFSRDPYPCMRKDTALEDAISAVEARVPAK